MLIIIILHRFANYTQLIVQFSKLTLGEMSQKAYQSIMDANISATQLLQEEKYNQGYQILRRIETTLKQEKEAPTIPLSQINHLLSVVTNNIGCFYYMVDKFQAAEKYLKQSIEYLQLSIPDETLLITLINLVILFIKNEKYSEASRYIEQSFTELNQLQDQQLNPKIRLFLGDHSSIMTLQSLEAILLFYSGLTFYELGQSNNALQAWKKVLDILQSNTKSPYYILTKSKIQNLEAENVSKNNKGNLYSSRSHLKSDRINKILEQYSKDNEKSNQQSFRLLSQKIKKKIGNEMGDYQQPKWQNKIEHNEKKIEINNYFSDQKKIQLQINVKDLLHQKSITQRDKTKDIPLSSHTSSVNQQLNKALKKRPTQHIEIIEKLNKTHNEIYKSYLAQRSNNGSKTQRGDSNIDIRIKVNDKSSHSQNTIQHNKSQDKKSVDLRESPELCGSPQQFFNMLQSTQSVIKSQLMRSGSQGSVSQTSPFRLAQSQGDQPKNNNKLPFEYAKTHRPMVDTYDKAIKELYQNQYVQIENKKFNRIVDLAQSVKNRISNINKILIQQEKNQQILQKQFSQEFNQSKDEDSCETIIRMD
ncbi:unnamed protein product [Paramecium sonneborni]|uniref:Uncharacterized protein n=1 Tax=Paramecium sonneborni TaxID=65129 RepID=A0A8S1PQL1_9CILI|nr:unnamed protein product [Paramecium sonneborni]